MEFNYQRESGRGSTAGGVWLLKEFGRGLTAGGRILDRSSFVIIGCIRLSIRLDFGGSGVYPQQKTS